MHVTLRRLLTGWSDTGSVREHTLDILQRYKGRWKLTPNANGDMDSIKESAARQELLASGDVDRFN